MKGANQDLDDDRRWRVHFHFAAARHLAAIAVLAGRAAFMYLSRWPCHCLGQGLLAAQGNLAIRTASPADFSVLIGMLFAMLRFMGYWLISGPGLRLPFFVHRHFAHYFHGTPGPLTLRIRLGIDAVRRGVRGRRRSRQRPASAPARAIRRSVVGLGLIAVSGVVMLWLIEPVRPLCRCGAGIHADLHDRHHHYQAIVNSKAMSYLPAICRHLDLGRRRADLHGWRRDQRGDQSRVRGPDHDTGHWFSDLESCRSWPECTDQPRESKGAGRCSDTCRSSSRTLRICRINASRHSLLPPAV